jgi:hypothetical protein
MSDVEALSLAPATIAAVLGICTAGWASPACASDGDKHAAGASLRPAIEAGARRTNPTGPCLTFRALKDAVIENVEVGPCGGDGILIEASQNVVVRAVIIRDAGGVGIRISGSAGVVVTESRIERTLAGIYALRSRDIGAICNTLEDARGPVPRGQHVQLDQVSGSLNRIACNVGRNRPGAGTPEDAINLHRSHGMAGAPIRVTRNLIIGGGPSRSGGGILLGDGGGSHQVASGNVLVDPGQYGVAVASGHDMALADNSVYARRQPFTNVGIYVWNQYKEACRSVTVSGNRVRWASASGRPNPFWDGRNCGPIAGLRENDFAAELEPEVLLAASAAGCACRSEGRR